MERYKKKFKETTIINFNIHLDKIENLNDLPKETQKFLYREITSFKTYGFQEVLGYIHNQLVISLFGYWIGNSPEHEKFHIESYGIAHLDKFDNLEIDINNLPLQWKNR